MEKIILYGAGKRGKKVANILAKKGIDIEFFWDLYSKEKEVTVFVEGGGGKNSCIKQI